MMPKVYITNDSGLDYSGATKFGELHKVTTGSIDIFNLDKTGRLIKEGLKDYDGDVDYLVISGNSLAAALTIIALYRLGWDGGPIKLLVFDSKKKEYFLRTVNLGL